MSASIEILFWIGLLSAPLGGLLLFRRMSFLGDAVGHSLLPGLILATTIGGLHPTSLMAGAFIAIGTFAFCFHFLESLLGLREDVALTLSYSGLLALGLWWSEFGGPIDLTAYLMGDLQSISPAVLWMSRWWTVVVWMIVLFYWKPLWATAIDPKFASSLKFSVRKMDFIFIILVSVSVVILMQAVGLLLSASFLIAPAIAALPWARSFKQMVVITAIFSQFIVFIGYTWSLAADAKAGPLLALTGIGFAILSVSLSKILSLR